MLLASFSSVSFATIASRRTAARDDRTDHSPNCRSSTFAAFYNNYTVMFLSSSLRLYIRVYCVYSSCAGTCLGGALASHAAISAIKVGSLHCLPMKARPKGCPEDR